MPWTDGKGDQEEYADSVKLWNYFHDKLPANNSNKIPVDLRGIMLQSALYGRAKDLCRQIGDEVIQLDAGVSAIIIALHIRDPLSAVSSVYQDFLALLSTKRGHSESVRNYKSRFAAAVSRFNTHAKSCELPEALTAFMLLANSDINSSQRISVLAAATSQDTNDLDSSSTDDYLKPVKYNAIASVLRQCEKTKGSETPNVTSAISAASSRSVYPLNERRTRKKKMLSPA